MLSALSLEDLGDDENSTRAALFGLYDDAFDQSSNLTAMGLEEDTLRYIIRSCMPDVQGSPNYNWV